MFRRFIPTLGLLALLMSASSAHAADGHALKESLEQLSDHLSGDRTLSTTDLVTATDKLKNNLSSLGTDESLIIDALGTVELYE